MNDMINFTAMTWKCCGGRCAGKCQPQYVKGTLAELMLNGKHSDAKIIMNAIAIIVDEMDNE